MVDDDAEDYYLTDRAFRDVAPGCDVVHVADGAGLFARLEEEAAAGERPDVVLLDINLGIENGFELLERLRADDRYRFLPVVMLSTSHDERDVYRAYETGANSYLCKPLDSNELRQVVRDFAAYWFESARLPSTPGESG